MKIIITGNGGTGKSTLAEVLGEKLNLPVIHLDKISFGKNWVRLDENEHRKILREILKSDNWIVEGWSYQSTMKERMEAAGIIIYLAYPAWFSYMNAVKRHLQYTFRYNPYDPPKSWIWKKTIRMFRAMNLVRRVYEPEYRLWLDEYRSTKLIFVIKKRKELEALESILASMKDHDNE
jgi:adenylate kinase family enzyme